MDATLDEFEILSSNSNIVTVEKIDGTLRIKASEIDGASFGTATVLIRHIPTNTTRILRVEIVPVIYEASPRVAAPKVAYGTSDNNAGFAVTLKGIERTQFALSTAAGLFKSGVWAVTGI